MKPMGILSTFYAYINQPYESTHKKYLGTPKLRYNERACQTPFVHYIARFTISNMDRMSLSYNISANVANTLLSFATPHPNS